MGRWPPRPPSIGLGSVFTLAQQELCPPSPPPTPGFLSSLVGHNSTSVNHSLVTACQCRYGYCLIESVWVPVVMSLGPSQYIPPRCALCCACAWPHCHEKRLRLTSLHLGWMRTVGQGDTHRSETSRLLCQTLGALFSVYDFSPEGFQSVPGKRCPHWQMKTLKFRDVK